MMVGLALHPLDVADDLLGETLPLAKRMAMAVRRRSRSLDGVIPLGMSWETYSDNANDLCHYQKQRTLRRMAAGYQRWPFWPEDKPSDMTVVHRLKTITTKDARMRGAYFPIMAVHSKFDRFANANARTGEALFTFVNGAWIPP